VFAAPTGPVAGRRNARSLIVVLQGTDVALVRREKVAFWWVWTKTGALPTIFHESEEEALYEAARLARKHPDRKFMENWPRPSFRRFTNPTKVPLLTFAKKRCKPPPWPFASCSAWMSTNISAVSNMPNEIRVRVRRPNPPMAAPPINVPAITKTIVGVDASLTNTGVAVLFDGKLLTRSLIPKKLKGVERLNWFYEEFSAMLVGDWDFPSLVVIEGYAFGAKMQREAMGELGGVLRLSLFHEKMPFVVVQPTSLKLFITGKGNGPKDNMSKEIYKRFGVDLTDNNQIDAAGLAIMGLAMCSDMALTEFQKRALGKVEK
jgi:Holliday junction resolvasome RuvABC endonuclease subunit